MKKKGSIFDMFFIALFVLFMAICFVIAFMIMSKVNTQIQAGSGFSDAGKEIVSTSTTRMVSSLDWVFFTAFIGLYLTSLVLAFQIDSNPIFFPISLILFIVLVLVSAVLGNVFYDFASSSDIAPYSSQFPVMSFIMTNFVKIILVMGFGLGWVMWGKSR